MSVLKKRESSQSFPFNLKGKEDFFSLMGGFLYFIQLWIYAHSTFSRLDESAYIYKGYLFATGQYEPFGPGLWTNKGPFSFLIPGYIQRWFGPGLGPARYFAVFLALLTLFGVWFTARRLSGKTWGMVVVWLFVFTPAFAKLYSPALSQGLIALMLTGVLALSLGGDRPLWQLSLSAALAGLMLLTRQNMVLILPLLIIYIFWQYGRKAGLWSLFFGGMVIFLGHLYWWPQIMQLWRPWLPEKLALWVQSLYLPVGSDIGGPHGSFDPSILNRISAFFLAFRLYGIILIGIIISFFLWQKKWKNKKAFRDAVFLAVLYLILFFMHAWASLGKNYCVYCFPSYLGFFNISGIFLILISFPSWKKSLPKYSYPLLIILILTLSVGIAFSASEDIGKLLVKTHIPRMKAGHFLTGNVDLMTLLLNKFQLSKSLTRQYASVVIGLSVGLIFLAGILFLNIKKKANFGYLALVSFLVFSFFASPFIAGSHAKREYAYGDMIAAYEDAGSYLAEYIPAGSLIYWKGGNSLLPLLYIPGGVEIYATQLNAYNNIKYGGDSEALLKLGLWNFEMDSQWKTEADYIVMINYIYNRNDEWATFLSPDKFEAYPPSSILLENRPDSFLRVFRRK